MNPEIKRYGISLQTYIPVRKEPHERAEMITQVLFGENVEIQDDEGKWLYIKLLFDGYEGWIDKKCILMTDHPCKAEYIITRNGITFNNLTTGTPAMAGIGCTLPEVKDGKFYLGKHQFEIPGDQGIIKPGNSVDLMQIVPDTLGVPYIWGGRSGFGFDCSGLVQYLCRTKGIDLPRDASEQSAVGQTLSFISEAKAGDLAFFDDTEGMIHHVGLMLGNGKIVHSSGTVRIDTIDQQGIFNEMIGNYTHKLRVMKRITK